jgi:hypothetical protein
MKAIITRFHGATNTRGSRITASDSDNNRVSIPYPHELNSEQAHEQVAYALCKKMKWDGVLIPGGLKRGNVYVFAPKGEMTVDKKLYNDLIAERKRLLDLMIVAVQYLDHPEVQAMNFAMPAKNVARAMHTAIDNLKG